MLLIQQSPTFRVWTSQALMLYFRRALLFLIVSQHQNMNNNNNHCLLQQQRQQPIVYFNDAKDDEDLSMIDEKKQIKKSLHDQNQNHSDRLQISSSKRNLLKEYILKRLSQGLNNSMIKSIEKQKQTSPLVKSINESSTSQSSQIFNSIELSVTKQFELSKLNSFQSSNSISIKSINNTNIHGYKIHHDSANQYQTNPLFSSCQPTSIDHHNQVNIFPSYNPHFNYTNPIAFYPVSLIHEKIKIKNKDPLYLNLQSCPSCQLTLSLCDSSNDDILSSTSSNQSLISKSSDENSSILNQQNHSELFDNTNDIYKKYQTSFSHVLHQTKSLHTIRKEDKLQSMLILEPNTSIITVRQLTYHHQLNSNNINHTITTNYICVRLIAHQTNLTIQCDTKPMKCQQTLSCLPMKYIQKPLIEHFTKPTSTNSEQQSLKFFNKNFEAISIL
ncbi:unnamed protein product [Rotaria sordida]|uniref:Uncharacterized protein n=1 Tax=Rotaria sordida TaxID=392033 RepID=A0A814LWG5_9BILA|nr:unnamed protein product [Rotaria sordida]